MLLDGDDVLGASDDGRVTAWSPDGVARLIMHHTAPVVQLASVNIMTPYGFGRVR